MSVWSAARTGREVRAPRAASPRPDGTGTPPQAAWPAGEGDNRSPWRVLVPEDALELRDPDLTTLAAVPRGTVVVLTADGPLSGPRLRRRAARAGVVVDRALVAIPSTRSPLALVDDDQRAVQHFWGQVVTVPPGAAWSSPVLGLVIYLGRRLPWRWTGVLAPGHVLIGRRA